MTFDKYLKKAYNEIYDERSPYGDDRLEFDDINEAQYKFRVPSVGAVTVYKADRRLFAVVDGEEEMEYEIILGYSSKGRGEAYPYVSHIEPVDNYDNDDYTIDEEELEIELDKRLGDIFQTLGINTK